MQEEQILPWGRGWTAWPLKVPSSNVFYDALYKLKPKIKNYTGYVKLQGIRDSVRHCVIFLAKTAFLKTSISHHSCLLFLNIKSPYTKSISVYFHFEEKNNCEHNSYAIFYSMIEYYCDFLVLMIYYIKPDDPGFPEVSATIAKIDGDGEL